MQGISQPKQQHTPFNFVTNARTHERMNQRTHANTHTRTSLLRGLFRALLVGSVADCLSFRSAASCGTTGGVAVASPTFSPRRRSPSGDRAAAAAGASASARAGFACFAFPPPLDNPRPPLPLPLDPELSPLGILVGAARASAPATDSPSCRRCCCCCSRTLPPPLCCHPSVEVEVEVVVELSARCVSDFTTALALLLLLLLLRPFLTVTMGGGLTSLVLLAGYTRGSIRRRRGNDAERASQGKEEEPEKTPTPAAR